METKKDVWDEALKEALDSYMDDIPVPNMDEVWANIESDLTVHKKKRFSMLPKIAVAASLLLVISLMGNKIIDKNQANPEKEIVKTEVITNGERHVGFKGFSQNKQNEAINTSNNYSEKYFEIKNPVEKILSKEELKKIHGIILPDYLPEGFDYTEGKLLLVNDELKRVDIQIINSNNSEDFLDFKQSMVILESRQSTFSDMEGSDFEEIKRNGITYYVFKTRHDNIYIITNLYNARIKISGKTSQKEELLKIAYLLKPNLKENKEIKIDK